MRWRTGYLDLMFCPKCGSTTVSADGRTVCSRTGMDFSIKVAEELAAIVAGPPRVSTPITYKVGGSWHCPADGQPLIESPGRLACPACNRDLPSLVIYQLIEFHAHPR